MGMSALFGACRRMIVAELIAVGCKLVLHSAHNVLHPLGVLVPYLMLVLLLWPIGHHEKFDRPNSDNHLRIPGWVVLDGAQPFYYC